MATYRVYCSPLFFQAEDGIRDDLVTGVQTCALPISPSAWTRRSCPWSRCSSGRRASRARARSGARRSRSEERRVGKECRRRGVAQHFAKEEDSGLTPLERRDAEPAALETAHRRQDNL